MNRFNILFFALLASTYSQVNAQNNVEQLTNHINGSQLVMYSESSYLSDNVASAITYIDFCPNGRYSYSYDGSYTVKGTQNTSNRNNRAYGAGVAEKQGNWKVVEDQGSYYLEITDYLGAKSFYPIYIQNLMAGKWKLGNTTYVFSAGSGQCN